MKKKIGFWLCLLMLPLFIISCGPSGDRPTDSDTSTDTESQTDNDGLKEEVAQLQKDLKKVERRSRATSFPELMFYFFSGLALWIIVWAVGAYLLWSILWNEIDAKRMNLRMKILLGPIYLILARANIEGKGAISNKKMQEIIEKINRLEKGIPTDDIELINIPQNDPNPQLVEQLAKLEDQVIALENNETITALNVKVGKLEEGLKNGGGRLISLDNGIQKLKEDLLALTKQQLSDEELQIQIDDSIRFMLDSFKVDLKEDFLTREEWINIPKGGGTNISRAEVREIISTQIEAQSKGLSKRQVESIVQDILLKQSLESSPTKGGMSAEETRALILAELSQQPPTINRHEIENIVREILNNYNSPEEDTELSQQGAPPPKDPTPPPRTKTEDEAFYTPAPHNGVFYKKRMGKEFKSLETMYKIIQISPNEAMYTLVDDPATLQKAFSVRNTYISPAMRIENPNNINLANYKRLRITPGSLVRVNDNWRILEKGVVKVS